MYNLVKVLIVILLLLYPIFIYFGLSYFSPSQLSIFLLAMFAVRVMFVRKSNRTARFQVLFAVVLGSCLAVLTWFFNSADYLKWYPVGLNLLFFIIFTVSIFNPPSVIEQLARLQHKDFPPEAVRYTRNVTVVWSVFFVINALISSWTVLYGTLESWTLYNGLISYIAMGLLIVLEILIRKYVIRLHDERD